MDASIYTVIPYKCDHQLFLARGELGYFVGANLFIGEPSNLLLGDSVFRFKGELFLVAFDGDSFLLPAKSLLLVGEQVLFVKGESVFFMGDSVCFFKGELVVFFTGESVFFFKGDSVFLQEFGSFMAGE